MKVLGTISLCACILAGAPMGAAAKSWRGLTPLRSMRADVERLLGHSDAPSGGVYKVENEAVFIQYQEGSCKDKPTGWNVARGTVINIEVRPIRQLSVAELPVDLSKFTKKVNPELPDFIHYIDAEEGVTYVVYNEAKVVNIYYHPTAGDLRFRCPKYAAPPLAPGADTYSSRPSVTYHGLRLNSGVKRLVAKFARDLEAQPTAAAYVIAYRGPGSRVRAVRAHLEQVKEYLNGLGVARGRIVIINGGYRKKPTVELFLRSLNLPPPAASPGRRVSG